MTDPYYVYQHDMYFLFLEDGTPSKRHTGLVSICMVYDPESYTLLKHGAFEACQEVANDYRSKGLEVSMLSIGPGVPLEEINKCLTTSGYVKFLLEKF
jgi:hypothetical protein